MLDRVRDAPGESFASTRDYLEDVDKYWDRISRFDKLERLQSFRQPGHPSWDAFNAGLWNVALHMLQQNRATVAAEFAEDKRRGIVSYRVRVVDLPVTPYLHWELHSLKLRAEYGEIIRIVTPEALARFERCQITPELIFMGDLAMYEIRYDDSGVLCGARKFTDPVLIAGCIDDVHALFGYGEDLDTFFAREIAPLPPPGNLVAHPSH
jgi:Family of unknown function (DUF6879)